MCVFLRDTRSTPKLMRSKRYKWDCNTLHLIRKRISFKFEKACNWVKFRWLTRNHVIEQRDRVNIAVTNLFDENQLIQQRIVYGFDEWVTPSRLKAKRKNWNGPFYRPIESSGFHFLTLTHFGILPPKKKRRRSKHPSDGLSLCMMSRCHFFPFYLIVWCVLCDFIIIIFFVQRLGRESESITLLQCMFVQCLCIPSIWHYYVRCLSSFFFHVFITFCCVARSWTTLFLRFTFI